MKGVRERKYGRQAFLRIRGAFVSQHFPPDTPDAEILEWQKNARAKGQLHQPQREPTGPTFDEDAPAYLAAVTSMPSYSDRELHMGEWAAIFAGRDRNSITPIEIRTQLELKRKTHAGSSCNKRRTALMSFYTALNGRSGYNPVRDVPRYPEADEEPRAQHPVTIYRILALMRPSKTRARLRVMITTGWPHAQIKRLKPEHVDLRRARAYVTPRRKGKGRKGGWLPLLPSAVVALKEFIQWEAFGPFNNGSLYRRFKNAERRLNSRRKAQGLPTLCVRPYDLRHSFGTWLAHRITDERALQELMMHSSPQQLRRYTDEATTGRTERALAGLRKLPEVLHQPPNRQNT